MDMDGGARAKLAILAMVALDVRRPRTSAPGSRRSPGGFSVCASSAARCAGCVGGDDDSLTSARWAHAVPLTPLARVNGGENLVAEGRRRDDVRRTQRGGDPGGRGRVGRARIARRAAAALRPAVTVDRVSSDTSVPYYVRFTVRDRPGIVAALGSVFAARAINIDAVLQEPGFPASARPFIVSLDESPSQIVRAAIDEIARLDFNVLPPLAMPVLRT
jgi:homoserine dehydrogenase